MATTTTTMHQQNTKATIGIIKEKSQGSVEVITAFKMSLVMPMMWH